MRCKNYFLVIWFLAYGLFIVNINNPVTSGEITSLFVIMLWIWVSNYLCFGFTNRTHFFFLITKCK